jgi:predicted PurR-regulated permease PerM
MSAENRIFWLVGAAILAWLLYLLAPVLTPFVAAALLAYVGDPMADRLQKLKLPRSLAVLAVFLLTFLVIGAIVLLVLPLVQAQIAALLEALPRYMEYVEQRVLPLVRELFGGEGAGQGIGLAAFVSDYGSMAGQWGSRVLASLGRSGGALLAALLSLFLVPILTFYLLRDWDEIVVRLGSLVPASRRDTVFRLFRETDEVLGAFLRGQLLVMAGLALIYTVGLMLLGLQFALAIGVVSGLVSFVPYLGFIFGIALAGLTAVNEPNALLMLLGVVAVFSVGQFIEGSVLTPKLVGDRIGLHPVVVIFAVMAFGQLFGFFGVLLALPAAAVLSVLARFAYRSYVVQPPPRGEDGDA